MNRSERLQIALPGGELQAAVLAAVQKSGLEITAANPRRYLHRRKDFTS